MMKEKEQEFQSLLGHHEAQTKDFEEQIAALEAENKYLHRERKKWMDRAMKIARAHCDLQKELKLIKENLCSG